MGTVKMNNLVLGTALVVALLLVPMPMSRGFLSSPAQADQHDESLTTFLERLQRKKKQKQASGQSNASAGHGDIKPVGKATTETAIVVEKNVAPMLAQSGAEQLRSAADRYRAIISQGGFPKVSRSNLKKGSKGKAVAALNNRLFVEGYVRVEATQGEFAEIFTTATQTGVERFQQNMGLAVTGKLDAQTADALNVSAQRRLATIEANIPRIEIYAENLGDRYLVVNIPAQQIETVADGRVFSKHNAIVGRPERPSPVVITALDNVAFNPYWNAPVSIVEKDIFPKLRSGTKILDEMNIKVFKGFGGPEIDPDNVNWRSAIPDDYHFRQEPGEGNAMAAAKINFPSPFGVYMHDTPEKQLFNSASRLFSSGCVRVQDMPLLVNWVLNGQDGIGDAEIATLGETLERRDVVLVEKPQLRFAYLTAWPTTGGTVAFRSDIYQLDGSGFTVGQPMPVGELSPDGRRFVLKPLPRLVASVEDENGGGGFFGFKRKPTTARKSLFLSGITDDDTLATRSSVKKLDPAAARKAKLAQAEKDKKAKAAKAKSGKNGPGLFDWAAWRKEQAALAKGGKPKKVVKKSTKDAATKTAKKSTGKPEEKKIASADKNDATTTKKKPAAVVAKADDKSKKPAATADKSVTTKKLDCAPAKDGKLPSGCKAAAADKKPATATN